MPIKPHNGDKWPPRVKIYVYDMEKRLIQTSKNIRYDLNDNLMEPWPYTKRIVYFGMNTFSTNWPIWDEESIKCIEYLIEYDLNFDGNEVVITRMTKSVGQPCTSEFLWLLEISS